MAMRNPAWHPHLDTQQRFAVVVRPVLALGVMQLLRLAGAGHRGVQQQQQPQRGRPWAQPHRARPARTRKAARREAGGAQAWQPCFTGGHGGAALHVAGLGASAASVAAGAPQCQPEVWRLLRCRGPPGPALYGRGGGGRIQSAIPVTDWAVLLWGRDLAIASY